MIISTRFPSKIVVALVFLMIGTGCTGDDLDTQLCDVVAVGAPDMLEQAASIIEQGADVNRQFITEDGVTCLMLASMADSPDMVELLLNAGADPNIETLNGRTALISAARGGLVKTAELLIEFGADVNHRSRDGVTPLSAAVGKEHEEVASLLRAAGALEAEDP